MHRTRSNLSSQRGSTIVEFALIAFLLLTVVFGLVEFCRMGLVYTDLCNASRVAVRYAITHGVDRSYACGSGAGCGSADGTASSSNICGTSGILTSYAIGLLNTANLSCTTSGLGGAVNTVVKVTVSYTYDPWFNLAPFKITLASTSQGVITY